MTIWITIRDTCKRAGRSEEARRRPYGEDLAERAAADRPVETGQ